MNRIASFVIDHLNHPAGIYLSRKDGDVYTYDVRMCKPYTDKRLSNSEMHSLEHLLATVMRNKDYGKNVLYVGPMGCQTGFYILLRNTDLQTAAAHITEAFADVRDFTGTMPGNTKAECGFYRNLRVQAAKNAAAVFLERLEKND